MKSSKSVLEELVLNASFQNYVLHQENIAEWQDWLEQHQHPEELQAFDQAQSMVQSFRIKGITIPETEIDDEITKFEQRIGQTSGADRTRVIPLWKTLSRIAAVFVLVGFISILYNNISSDKADTQQISQVIKETPRGNKLQVRLPDGTMVKLNSGSTLKYPSVFTNDSRRVELVGEAFFEVVKDKSRPFLVSTPHLQTQVLGTAFTVKSFENGESKVSLIEGSVRVSAHGKNKILEPGNQVVLKNESLVVQAYDYNEEFGWREGILYFNDAGASEVFNKLRLWYGVEFEFGQQDMPVARYSGYYKKQDLETVLKGLSYSLKFDYEISDRTIKVIFHQKNMPMN